MALNGSFTTYFFFGDFEDVLAKYCLQLNLGGASTVIAAPVQVCDNCKGQDADKLVVTDTTNITPILLDFKHIGQLPDLAPKNVVPFLKERLKWRVVTVNCPKFFLFPSSLG